MNTVSFSGPTQGATLFAAFLIWPASGPRLRDEGWGGSRGGRAVPGSLQGVVAQGGMPRSLQGMVARGGVPCSLQAGACVMVWRGDLGQVACPLLKSVCH